LDAAALANLHSGGRRGDGRGRSNHGGGGGGGGDDGGGGGGGDDGGGSDGGKGSRTSGEGSGVDLGNSAVCPIAADIDTAGESVPDISSGDGAEGWSKYYSKGLAMALTSSWTRKGLRLHEDNSGNANGSIKSSHAVKNTANNSSGSLSTVPPAKEVAAVVEQEFGLNTTAKEAAAVAQTAKIYERDGCGGDYGGDDGSGSTGVVSWPIAVFFLVEMWVCFTGKQENKVENVFCLNPELAVVIIPTFPLNHIDWCNQSVAGCPL
jgi:hypothetical protein